MNERVSTRKPLAFRHPLRAKLGPIVMREWTEADLDGYAELIADPRVMRYISDGATRSRSRAKAEIECFRHEIRSRGWSRFVIARSDDDGFAGYMGFQEVDGEIDFGGRLLRRLWRGRIGPLGYCLALEYGFDVLGFQAVFATVHPENKNALALTNAFFGGTEGRRVKGRHGVLLRFDLDRHGFYESGVREANRHFMITAARGAQVIYYPVRHD